MDNMTPIEGRVLIVDDDEDVLAAARLFLKQYVSRIETETDPTKIPELLLSNSYDVILLDMNFTRDITSGREGFEWLARILEIDPLAVVILITAFGDADVAVKAIKAGATDFAVKPWQNEKLLATVSAGVNLRRSRVELGNLKTRQRQMSADMDQPYHDFIGTCPAMQRVFTLISKVAQTDANVLILGENGTGKELAARAVYRQSQRANEVFVKVDMGAIAESLFESELFGHAKGSFTDAREDRAGRFETATGGTLFLDELGNLPLPLQAKILSALQSRQVTRIGSNQSRPIDIRLVCASNRPLTEMVATSEFREDLLYRINTVEICLPPLRERQEDVPLLADHFQRTYTRKYAKSIKSITSSAISKLQKYHWPGNVRELQHAIERAIIMSDTGTLGPEDFVLNSASRRANGTAYESSNLEDIEKTVIRRVLTRHEGNVSRAAGELGLTRTSLYRRMQKHGL